MITFFMIITVKPKKYFIQIAVVQQFACFGIALAMNCLQLTNKLLEDLYTFTIPSCEIIG